jgi:hypothetical protein
LFFQQARKRVEIDAKSPRIGKLRHQAKIGHGRRLAEAERAGLAGDQGFAGRKTLAVGPCRPARHCLFGKAKLAQPRQHFQILHRVGIAGQRHREGTDFGAAQRMLRQQRRFGMDFLQPFDDGERLGDDRAPIVLQRRHQPLRIEREIGGIALFALAKMVRQVIGA